jgi:hypothetical protein
MPARLVDTAYGAHRHGEASRTGRYRADKVPGKPAKAAPAPVAVPYVEPPDPPPTGPAPIEEPWDTDAEQDTADRAEEDAEASKPKNGKRKKKK